MPFLPPNHQSQSTEGKISTGHTSVDIGASANLELVEKFCYLGDILSVDGDADAAVEARTRIGWNKFRQLVALLVVINNERETVAVVCEVVCCMVVRPGL